MEKRSWIHQGRSQTRFVASISGYIFIEYYDVYRYYEVASQPGFVGFIGGGHNPDPIRSQVVEDLIIRASSDEDSLWEIVWEKPLDAKSSFQRGDCVTVMAEALPGQSNLRGVVEWTNDSAQIASISLFGLFNSEQRTEVSFAMLSKVDITSKTQRKTFFDLPVLAPRIKPIVKEARA